MNKRQLFAYENPINYGEPTDLFVAEHKCEVAGVEATLTSALFCSRERAAFDGRPYWALLCGVRSELGHPLVIGSLEEADLFKLYSFCSAQLEGVGLTDDTWQTLELGQVTATLVRAMSDEEIAGQGKEWARIRVADHEWTNVSHISGAPLDRDATLSAKETAERDEITSEAIEFIRKWNRPIIFQFDIADVVALIGQVQIALRHPRNVGATRDQVEGMVRGWIECIDSGHGPLHQLLMMGFDPQFDATLGEGKSGNDAHSQ